MTTLSTPRGRTVLVYRIGEVFPSRQLCTCDACLNVDDDLKWYVAKCRWARRPSDGFYTFVDAWDWIVRSEAVPTSAPVERPSTPSPVVSFPHVCPACGSPALRLFSSVECSNGGCVNARRS